MPNTDVLYSNSEGTRFVHIQVKTFRPGDRTCHVGKNAEKNYGKNSFHVLAGVPLDTANREFEYYVVPADRIAKNVSKASREWLSKRDHRDSTVRIVRLPRYNAPNRDCIKRYRERWELIEACLSPYRKLLAKLGRFLHGRLALTWNTSCARWQWL